MYLCRARCIQAIFGLTTSTMTTGIKWMIGISFVIIALSQIGLWGKHGLPTLWELSDLNSSDKVENDKIKLDNHKLVEEISNMKSGLEIIEKEAREELGMIKKGETFFWLINHNPEYSTQQ